MVLKRQKTLKTLIDFYIIIRVEISTCTPKKTLWNFLYLIIRKKAIDVFYTEPNKLVGSLLTTGVQKTKIKLVQFYLTIRNFQ